MTDCSAVNKLQQLCFVWLIVFTITYPNNWVYVRSYSSSMIYILEQAGQQLGQWFSHHFFNIRLKQ